jgi:hypothetical protein
MERMTDNEKEYELKDQFVSQDPRSRTTANIPEAFMFCIDQCEKILTT